METQMKFNHFQFLMEKALPSGRDTGEELPAPEQLPPLVLAYIGDAFFNLHIRTMLLKYEQNKVRVLHTYGAQMVSAAMQALAVRELSGILTEKEASIVRRGRNTKSKPAKNATVGDYRYSTGFEALLGYLYLAAEQERLLEITEKAVEIISRAIIDHYEKFGDK
ncbi:MAG: hypothetical protein H6Q65_461 [Firmicutes bacterium]|nr:hypothetical protein [Bacillota bacterium]